MFYYLFILLSLCTWSGHAADSMSNFVQSNPTLTLDDMPIDDSNTKGATNEQASLHSAPTYNSGGTSALTEQASSGKKKEHLGVTTPLTQHFTPPQPPEIPQPLLNTDTTQNLEIPTDTEEPAKPAAIGERYTINKIVARVNGENILQSFLEEPRIEKNGQPFTDKEAITNVLLFQRATTMHLRPTEEDINRNLVAFKIQNNLTDLSDKEFEQELKRAGFDLPTYKTQIGRMLATDRVKQVESSQNSVIPYDQIQEVYDATPEYTIAEYYIKVATIPTNKFQEDQRVSDYVLDWDEAAWIDEPNLAEKYLHVIKAMKVGTISEPIASNNEYDVINLVDKREPRLKTLNERYSQIERALQEKNLAAFATTFEEDLEKEATIVRLD